MVLAHNIEDGERTRDVQISQGVTFDSMLLAPNTLDGLKSSGFYKPSPIQLHGIPMGKCGFDLLLEAKSGTGKTAVFSIIALEQLDMTKGLQTIILAPTREIAAQVCDVIKQIGSHYKGLKVEVVMGGLPVQEDIAKFKNKKVHILVGSPGRLRHLIQDKHVNISSVRLLILDEADKLIEKSFLADINYIFSVLPKQKQVLMSSATYPEDTKTFIKQYAQSAHHVCPETNSILLGIKQKVTVVKNDTNTVKQTQYRFEELLKILSKHAFKQCLIFCNYQAKVGELHRMLKKQKWPAEQLYGQQEQLDRLDALKSLQDYKCRILIATDLAARGIDASNVDFVINFEAPFEWQTYLHRIGRAGRFGSYGTAITILSKGKEQEKFTETLNTIKAPINLTNLWKDENDITEAGEPFACNSVLFGSTESAPGDFDSSDELTVESFSDLINSLEGHQQEANINGCNFHNLKMQKMPIPQFIKATRSAVQSHSKEEKTQKHPSGTTKTNKNYTLEMNSYNSEDTSDVSGACSKNKDSLSNTKAVAVDTHIHHSTEQIHVGNRNYDENESNEYEFSTDVQALQRAGLPTAFGNPIGKKVKYSKHKSYIPNYRNHSKDCSATNIETNKNCLSYKDTENSDTSQGFYNARIEKYYITHGNTKKSNKHQKKPAKKSGYDVDDENYDNGEDYLHCQYTKTYKKHNNPIQEESHDYDDDCANVAKYMDWYKQLKLRVQQVQQAVYIEEMSRLHYP